MRRFELHRDTDVTGLSGTGVVAEGVTLTGGGAVTSWFTGQYKSVVVWNDMDAIEAIHGHAGATRVVWLDPEES